MPEDFDTTITEPIDMFESEDISTDTIDISPVDAPTDFFEDTLPDFSEDLSNETGINDFEDAQDCLAEIPEDTELDTLDTGLEDTTEAFPEDIQDYSVYEEMADVAEIPEDINDGGVGDEVEAVDTSFAEDIITETDAADDSNDSYAEGFAEDIDMEAISATSENDLNDVNAPNPYDVPDDWVENASEPVQPTELTAEISSEIPDDFLPSEASEYMPTSEAASNDIASSTTWEDIDAKIDEISESNLPNEQKIELFNKIKDELSSETVDGDGSDSDPVKILKRDEMDLLSSGNKNIDDILSVKADDYRDKGYSEEEISSMLANDKIPLQEEFLRDAFPGQDVSTAVFDAFDQENSHQPSPQADLSAQELQYSLSDMKTVDDVSGWLSDINPNYDAFDPESPYCNNCGSCAYAVHQRLDGNPNICASVNNIGFNSEMEALTGMEQISMSPSEIEQRLLAEGDGAHAIIGIDRAQGAGHWFNAACLNGKVVAIDGQSGEIMDWPPDYGDVVNWEMSIKKGF